MEPTNQVTPKVIKNYRRRYNEAGMAILVADIKAKGVLQSILVRGTDKAEVNDAPKMISVSDIRSGKYQLIAGNRRVDAVEIAFGENAQIPALVRTMTDAEAMAAMVSENKIREDTTAIEDAEAAMKLVGLLNGNREEAAKRLGWSLATLNARLGIMNATDTVRDAYIDEKILLGHVEILAALVKEVQDNVLGKMLAHPTSVTVSELKLMAEQLLLNLDAAIFNKDECATCHFNTGKQQAMFETSFEGTRCTKRECYLAKTEVELESRREALTSQFQVVRIVRPGDNNTVISLRAEGPKGVGAEQALACRTCGDFGACVSALPDKMGATFKDICFKPSCNAEKVKLNLQVQNAKTVAAEIQTAEPTAATEKGAVTTLKQATPAGAKAPQATQSAKTPPASSEPRNAIKEYRESVWRGVFQRGLLQLPVLQSRAMLITLCLTRPQTLDHSKCASAVDKALGVGSLDTSDAGSLLSSVLGLEQQEMGKVMQHIPAFVTQDLPITEIKTMMTILGIELKTHWKISSEFFELLTKTEIDAVCVELGIDKAAGTDYAKLKNGGKADYVKAMLSVAGYDFSGKIPKLKLW